MPIATPPLIVVGFATGGDRNVIPVAADPAQPAAASYDLGFPPATRTKRSQGGKPPAGRDMNGILHAVSSNAAWLVGGMGYSFSQAFSDANSGYALGAVLKSASDPTKWYYNRSNGNTNDPDVSTAGWTSFSLIAAPTAIQTVAVPAGVSNDLVIADGVGLVNLDTTAGAATINGLVPSFDGQQLVVRNPTANLLTLAADAGASAAANRWRLPANMALVQGQSKAFKNFASLPGWVAL